MQTMYIDRKGSELDIQGGRLLVRIADHDRPFSVPLNVLEFLVISASVTFSSTLLTRLTMAGVTAVFLNTRKEEATCIAYGLLHNDTQRRLMQYQAITHPALQLRYAKELVRQKLRGQRATLVKALRKRPDQRYSLRKGIERLAAIEKRIDTITSADSLRGIEGSGAAMYFEAYQTIFPSKLMFHGRNRRPPKDPVNAVLSLSYTLLHAEAIRALVANGFDPHLGVYHLPAFGRESLACDLVEVFRSLTDAWVWRLFADETLRPDHFSEGTGRGDNSGCLLGKAGRSIYYSHYERKVGSWRKLMRRTVRQWLSVLQQDLAHQKFLTAARVSDDPLDDHIDYGNNT